MSARKKWATQFPQVPGVPKKNHESQAAAYRYIDAERANWACGVLRSSIVQVYVDTREGLGWQLFERIDLDEGGQS